MQDDEVIIVTGGTKCLMFNAQTGNKVQEYKTEQIHPRTLALLGEDYCIGVCKNKQAIKTWMLGAKTKSKSHYLDLPIPGHATALAVTSCGNYCFVGIGKELYVWKLTSGSLLAIIQQHYQDITCIKISSDDSFVITGGKDGHVNVWLLVDLVAADDTSERRQTRHSWTNHSNEVTDIHVSPLGVDARVATVSLDMTCRLYELGTGVLLTTICLDVPLSAVTMDTLECFVFIGTMFGDLHKINLFERMPIEIHDNEQSNGKSKIHESKIVDLQISFDGSKLLTASDDGSVKIFLLDSFSCVTRIPREEFDGAGISNAMFASLPLAVLLEENYKPVYMFKNLRRNLEESRGEKVTTYTRVSKRNMPDMLEKRSSPIDNYVPGTFVDAVADDDPRKEMFEGAFRRIANGPTVAEITAVNNEMFAIACKFAMDNYAMSKKLHTASGNKQRAQPSTSAQ